MNAVMQEFFEAFKDGRITKKKRKGTDGSSSDVFDVDELFGKLAVADEEDAISVSSGPSI